VLDQQFDPTAVATLPPYAQATLEKYSSVDARGRNRLRPIHGHYHKRPVALGKT